jgi:hypothetical protein
MVDEAIKFDENKVRLELLPTDAIEAVADVLTFGAKKYGDHNWEKGFDYTRVIGSLLRHVFAFAKGEDLDPESGKSHLAHAACNVLFLLTFTLRGTGRDDRPKGGRVDIQKAVEAKGLRFVDCAEGGDYGRLSGDKE